jgi:putative beta-lysine N-acetyltransferase
MQQRLDQERRDAMITQDDAAPDLGPGEVIITSDPFSDRVRCDHPEGVDGDALARRLLEVADRQDRGRVVVMANAEISAGLRAEGFRCEATIQDFYGGEEDCFVMGAWPDTSRRALADEERVSHVMEILEQVPHDTTRALTETARADIDDAPEIARLIGDTFDQYPTPSHDPGYIAADIAKGTPYRVVRQGGEVVACASASLVEGAGAAELTDCATRPSSRGKGLMQSLLAGLLDDLEGLEFSTAFTMARANQAGMNIVFKRLGFDYNGTMAQSCRIGRGIEDMNVWSRPV